MTKGYVILTEDVHDRDGMNAYAAAAGPSMTERQVTVLAVDRSVQVIEGEWHGSQTILLEFESVEAAHAWYNSAPYQAAKQLRQQAADSNVVIVAGLGPA